MVISALEAPGSTATTTTTASEGEAGPPHRVGRRPALVQGRDHLRGADALVLRQQRRRHRRLPRPHRASSTTSQDLGVTALWLLPFYPSPGQRRRLRHRRLHRRPPRRRHARRLRRVPRRGAPARPPRHHRAGAQPHLGPAPVVPARAPRARRVSRSATSTSGATRPSATARRASSSRTSSPRTGPGIRVANAYFWHRFYAHQPDLNFENPAVHEAMLEVVDFWLGLGVDGLRLDAVPVPLRGGGDELREPRPRRTPS